MRILLVSSQDYIHHPIPSRHHYIFERLAKRHNIDVAHFHISNGKTRYTNMNVAEMTLFPFKNLLLHYTLNSPYHLYMMNKIIKEDKIDIVVAAHVLAGTAAVTAAKWNNIPVLFDLKDWFPDSAAAYFKQPLMKKIVHDTVLDITKYNLENSTKITTVSPNLVIKLKSMGFESQLITNGVDTSIFKPDNSYTKGLRGVYGIKDDEFVVGFAGSVEQWYDLESLLSLPKLLPYEKIRIMFVGGSLFTDCNKRLMKKTAELGLEDKVTFVGLVPYDQLPKYINCMDVCTIPLGPADWRNIALPNKFFEYTACGKPILSTYIPNILDFNSPNVYIYKDAEDMVGYIELLIHNKQTYNIDFSKQDWDYKAHEMEVVLQDLVNENIRQRQISFFKSMQYYKR